MFRPKQNKPATTILAIIILLIGLSQTSFATTFSDLSNNHPDTKAISDLANRGILNGYPDGSFKPNQALNRAELTKIVIESIKAKPTSANCFPDVNQQSWYSGYVCQAKEMGLVSGYPDGKFRPEQTINRAEALKIIALSQNWSYQAEDKKISFSDVPQSEWYKKFADYVATHNLSNFGTNLNPSLQVTRGQFSQIYYRILVSKENNTKTYTNNLASKFNKSFNEETDTENNQTETNNNEENQINENSSNINLISTYNANSFNNLELSENLPKEFYKNELYLVKGKILSGNYDSIFAFIYQGESSSNAETISVDTVNDEFTIPVKFSKAGEFNFGLIPGQSGNSKILKIKVIDTKPVSNNATANFGLSVDHDSEGSFVNLNSKNSSKTLEFNQGNQKASIISRQNIARIPLNYTDFANFNEGNISLTISDKDGSQSLNFSAIKHHYSESTNGVEINNLPIEFEPGRMVTISGKAKTKLNSQMSIIEPDKRIKKIGSSGEINQNQTFNFDFTPVYQNTYIIEINNLEGIAVINHPIYPSNKVPLIPDFFDLNPVKLDKNSIDEASARQTLLNLINKERTAMSLKAVTLDTPLNQLAQKHNLDMANRNFFGHINPEGEDPNDRRLKAGIKTIVGENLAKTVSLEHAHEGLIRSAVHLENILNPNWTEVGLAIYKDSEGYVYVTQEFSTSIEASKDYIIDGYQNSNNNKTSQVDLTNAAQTWSQKMVDQNFFQTSFGNETIFGTINNINQFQSLRSYIFSGQDADVILSSILSKPDLTEPSFNYYGFGFSYDDQGTMKITILVAK